MYLRNKKKTLAGDIGYYTTDGYFFIVDRLKEMFKCMDRQVVPAELEDILLSHPDVSEAVVIGVPHIEHGEAARAFIVLRDRTICEEVTESKLRRLVEGNLPGTSFLLRCSCKRSTVRDCEARVFFFI